MVSELIGESVPGRRLLPPRAAAASRTIPAVVRAGAWLSALLAAATVAACGGSQHATAVWSKPAEACRELKSALVPPDPHESSSPSVLARALDKDIATLAALKEGAPREVMQPLSDLLGVYNAVDRSLKGGSGTGMSAANQRQGWSDVEQLTTYAKAYCA